MLDVLKELKERVGIRGALVMSDDGVVVASDLCDGLQPDSVAALASAAIVQAARATSRLGLGPAERVTLSARFGRLVFIPLEGLLLVAVTEPGLALDLTMLEIAGPALRIRELARLDSRS